MEVALDPQTPEQQRRRCPSQEIIPEVELSPRWDGNEPDDSFFDQVASELRELSPETIRRDLGLSTPSRCQKTRSRPLTDTDTGSNKENSAVFEPLETQETRDEHVCAICLEPVDQGEAEDRPPLVLRTNCAHEFHLKCLKQNRHYSPNCPMCRTPLAEGLTPEHDRSISHTGGLSEADRSSAPFLDVAEAADAGEEAVGDGGHSNIVDTPEQVRQVSEVMQDINEGNFPEF